MIGIMILKKIYLILYMNSMYFKMVIPKNDYDNEIFRQLLASKFGSFIFRKKIINKLFNYSFN